MTMKNENSTKTLSVTSDAEARTLAAVRIRQESPRSYLAFYEHRNARGITLNFKNRPWSYDLYSDKSEQIVIEKSSKTGISELLVVDLFANAMNSLNGMYVLPTQPIRNRFVSDRIDRIVRQTPLYRANTSKHKKDVNAKGLKTFFNTTWSFVGSNSEEDFYEFDADMMIYDEFDKCNPRSLTFAGDRTGAAASDIWRKVGNPTIGGFGIDAEYQKSDKKVWMIPCPHCGDRQPLYWFINFIVEDGQCGWRLRDEGINPEWSLKDGRDAMPVCRKCGKSFDRLGDGEWVPEFFNRDVSGYQVSRLFGAPGNDHEGEPRNIIREIFKSWIEAQGNDTKLIRFYNNVLGIPYRASGSNITIELLQKCAIPGYYMPLFSDQTVFGIDVGKFFHVHISKLVIGEDGVKRRRKVFIGKLATIEEVEKVLDRYGAYKGCIDAMPELHTVRPFVQRKPGRFMVYYNQRDNVAEKSPIDYKKRTIRLNRTESLDASHADYILGNVELPCNFASLDDGDFVKQMEAPTRVLDIDVDPPRYKWDEGNEPDHHRHADNLEKMAADMLAGQTLFTVYRIGSDEKRESKN